jgi:hypothetical protein
VVKPTNSVRNKFERYFAQDRHNPDLRREAYTYIAAKMARTIHTVIKSIAASSRVSRARWPSGRRHWNVKTANSTGTQPE